MSGFSARPAHFFVFRLRVTYAHCTLGDHVYYARYLDFLEQARGEFFREWAEPLLKLQERDTIFPVTECSLRFLKAARYDDELEILTWVSNLSRIRLRFEYEIKRGDQLLVRAWSDHVCASAAEKPKRIPEELAERLRTFTDRLYP